MRAHTMICVLYGFALCDTLLQRFFILNYICTVDECEMDNGGCEQICTDTFLSFGCSCTYGYVLNSDGVSCSGYDSYCICTVYNSNITKSVLHAVM